MGDTVSHAFLGLISTHSMSVISFAKDEVGNKAPGLVTSAPGAQISTGQLAPVLWSVSSGCLTMSTFLLLLWSSVTVAAPGCVCDMTPVSRAVPGWRCGWMVRGDLGCPLGFQPWTVGNALLPPASILSHGSGRGQCQEQAG